MIELQYPTLEVNAEYFPLIDEEGHVVGQAPRRYCHGGSMALHPVVHLHIFDHEGRLYLQKRSMKKDIAPGLWDTSVGGHVDYGESLDAAVRREAREELGVKSEKLGVRSEELGAVSDDGQPSSLRFLFQYIWQSSRERELVTAFAVTYDGELHPDHDEVDEGRFFTIDELRQLQGNGMFTQQFEEQELKHLLACL